MRFIRNVFNCLVKTAVLLILGFIVVTQFVVPWIEGSTTPEPAAEEPMETEELDESETEPPDATEEPEPGFQFGVYRETPEVKVGPSEPLPNMINAGPADLPEGHMVSTDRDGEALLQGEIEGKTCSIFVFFASRLTKSACPASTTTGNTSCQTGSAVYRECDGLLIQTPSMEAFQVGTWTWITYLEDEEITVVVTSNGTTRVWPVLDADGWVVSDEAIDVPAENMLYTAPDDMLDGRPGFPAREARSWGWLLALLNQYPELIPWMERAFARARQDGVPLPNPGNLNAGPDLTVELEVLGPAEQIPEELSREGANFGIPVLVRVNNFGDQTADPSQIAIEGINPDGTNFIYPFNVFANEGFPYANVPHLPPGEHIEYQGWVVVNPTTTPPSIMLTAIADSCAGQEFAEPFCRVNEYDEGNNRSEPMEAAVR